MPASPQCGLIGPHCPLIHQGERRFRLDDIVGQTDGIGVENLRGSGMIAGETSAAYEESFTLSYVTGRSVGIGAYLNRLAQRVIQMQTGPCGDGPRPDPTSPHGTPPRRCRRCAASLDPTPPLGDSPPSRLTTARVAAPAQRSNARVSSSLTIYGLGRFSAAPCLLTADQHIWIGSLLRSSLPPQR